MSVIYVKEQGAVLGIVNERLQIRRKRKLVQEIPAVHVDSIVLMVPAYITQQAIRYLMDRGVDITYVSQNGKFYGQFTRGNGTYVQLRLMQFRKYHDAAFRLELARKFVQGKLHNILSHWRRQRRHGDLNTKLSQLQRIYEKLAGAKALDSLRGFEGSAAVIHYSLLRSGLQGNWKFRRRAYNPAPDPVNAMLSLGYTLLYSRMSSLLHIHGLDPFLGFFHEPKRGHAALASDLIEEWRCPAVDALVMRLVNTQQISTGDFSRNGKKCIMNRRSLEVYVQAFEKRLLELNDRSNNSKDPVHGMEGQVRQLARVLLEKQKQYQPILI